jgi:hypothetical protein
LGAVALAAAAGLAIAGPASAAVADQRHPGGGAVFVQTDNIAGNRVVSYDRSADGTLRQSGSYPTGGRRGTRRVGEIPRKRLVRNFTSRSG